MRKVMRKTVMTEKKIKDESKSEQIRGKPGSGAGEEDSCQGSGFSPAGYHDAVRL
jgi:hypothetical protein